MTAVQLGLIQTMLSLLSAGAMATYMIFPKDSLTHKIPKSLDPFHAVFAEPLACAVHAVNRANVGLNDVVVVSGCGAIGYVLCSASIPLSGLYLFLLCRLGNLTGHSRCASRTRFWHNAAFSLKDPNLHGSNEVE